jgi:hypothetical protein
MQLRLPQFSANPAYVSCGDVLARRWSTAWARRASHFTVAPHALLARLASLEGEAIGDLSIATTSAGISSSAAVVNATVRRTIAAVIVASSREAVQMGLQTEPSALPFEPGMTSPKSSKLLKWAMMDSNNQNGLRERDGESASRGERAWMRSFGLAGCGVLNDPAAHAQGATTRASRTSPALRK